MVDVDIALQSDASDPEQAEYARRKQEQAARDRVAQVRGQLATYEGRAFVWAELEDAAVFEDITGSADVVYRLLGRRSRGLRLLKECERHPELFLQMQREHLARVKRERDERIAEQMKRAGRVPPGVTTD